MLRLLILIVLCWSASAPAAPRVAASIAPLHSIASGIMQGAGEPELVIPGGVSPHHATLRPSQTRSIARADIVFWVSPALESFMPRMLAASTRKQQSITLIDAPGIEVYPARAHGDDHASAQAHGAADTHIWLSPANAKAMAQVMADALIRSDPANAPLYRGNLERLLERIDALDRQIRAQLSTNRSAFITYHDAYQYFERSYGLDNAGSLSSTDDAQPGSRTLLAIRKQIEEDNIQCLFYDAPAMPALARRLQSETGVRAVELDPLGIRQQTGADAWFDLMKALASAYASCLQN